MEAYLAGSRSTPPTPAPTCRGSPASPASSSPASTPRSTAGSTRSASPEALALRGKAAIAQGKLAYQLFRATFSGRPLGRAGGPRRPRAAPAVGEHVDQEPGLLRHALRRRADRPRHRQHAARGHDRGVRRPRHVGRTVDADVDEAEAHVGGARRRRRRHGRCRRPARARGRRQLPEELRRADRRPRQPRPTSSAPD